MFRKIERLKQRVKKEKRKEKMSIARNLLKANIDIDTIVVSTGLSQEEIGRI